MRTRCFRVRLNQFVVMIERVGKHPERCDRAYQLTKNRKEKRVFVNLWKGTDEALNIEKQRGCDKEQPCNHLSVAQLPLPLYVAGGVNGIEPLWLIVRRFPRPRVDTR